MIHSAHKVRNVGEPLITVPVPTELKVTYFTKNFKKINAKFEKRDERIKPRSGLESGSELFASPDPHWGKKMASDSQKNRMRIRNTVYTKV
jgi:hypothetical protein